jgi:response regulator RpfG family c-di-GMP phosphodiesterase
MNDTERMIFAKELEQPETQKQSPAWKILIADDEKEVHSVTKMVLYDYTFDGKRLEFLSTYSGKETKTVINNNPDTALILLDVVMEEDDSGLSVVEYIRHELKNNFVRIILRTGQPGQAPEKKVITEYDINDYKEKTDLTSQKLFTTITASLRAYRDLLTIDENRRGLEQLLTASAALFEHRSLSMFSQGVLRDLTSILSSSRGSKDTISGFALNRVAGNSVIIRGTGCFEKYSQKNADALKVKKIQNRISRAIRTKQSLFYDNAYVGFFAASNEAENVLYLSRAAQITPLEKSLIKIFSTVVSVAFENLSLNHEIEETQKELLFTLGEIVENRSGEVGNHVRRVASISHLLARKAGISAEEAELLRLASPMHDVGKIAIPDAILNKPGPLSEFEFDIVKKHTTIGYNILKNSNRKLLYTAAIIALQHHERWDGQGYPHGLAGDKIHLFGRITQLADVFDALSKKRIYKNPWDIERILEYIRGEREKQFDPEILDLFFENFEEISAILSRFAY